MARAFKPEGYDVNPKKAEEFFSSPLVRAIFRFLLRKNGRETYFDLLWDAVIEEKPIGEEDLLFYFLYLLTRTFYKQNEEKGLLRAVKDDLHTPYAKKGFKLLVESIAKYGLTTPQVFASPFLIVWNFTNACNLRCIHCYQDARKRMDKELTTQEKLNIIDQMDEMDVPYLAFSGGEPLLARDFYQVAEYAASKGMYISVATNGTLITEEVARRLKDIGVRYVEVSLDSADPEKHDMFRGVKGYWKKAVRGIENAVGEGLLVGLAPTITKLNHKEVDKLYKLAIDLGCGTLYCFNFIPVGRARGIEELDLNPVQREEVLRKLYGFLMEDRLTALATAPQYVRVCMESGGEVFPTSHYSLGKGEAARTMAKYIGGCGAGRAYISIEPDGKVTPCVFMKLVVGDLRKQRLKDIWEKSEVLNILRDRSKLKLNCKTCKFRDYCGGCRARAYNYFGDITAPDPGCINNIKYWNRLHKEDLIKEAV